MPEVRTVSSEAASRFIERPSRAPRSPVLHVNFSGQLAGHLVSSYQIFQPQRKQKHSRSNVWERAWSHCSVSTALTKPSCTPPIHESNQGGARFGRRGQHSLACQLGPPGQKAPHWAQASLLVETLLEYPTQLWRQQCGGTGVTPQTLG